MANCPINEVDGDGRHVGRCWMYLEDGKTCSRHGDVSKYLELLPKLTSENELNKEVKNG